METEKKHHLIVDLLYIAGFATTLVPLVGGMAKMTFYVMDYVGTASAH